MRNNNLPILDDILYKNLAPWLTINNPDEIFYDRIDEVKISKSKFNYIY
jgi:hypothetical protein